MSKLAEAQPTTESPVPLITTRTATHGRLVESQTGGMDVRTWCGKTLTMDPEPFTFPMPGVGSSTGTVDCGSCQRTRWAGREWRR